ncbi:MAG: flagellar hook assembly protein FlgD [Geobacteraceae bacterium]|nr:flagellar hook assembly protein FlgD [Geobacteraceae bacterium]
MTTAVTGISGTTTTSAADAMKKELGMNTDDFLKLFVAQLQYQDPLAPQDPTEMLGQLAQLTQVEQSYNTTTALNNLLAAQNSSLASSAVSLIGGTITATGKQANFDGTNAATMKYSMPVATSSTTLTITNASGNVVRTVNLGPQASGAATYQWDGCDGQGNKLAAGAYTFGISGLDAAGGKQTATTYTTGVADSVSFDNGLAYISIGAVTVPYSSVTKVSVS